MEASTRVVCWHTREEWLEIYRWLYSFEEPNLQKKAVDRIAAWRSRSGGKLPLAVESTAHLVSAHLADDLSSNSYSTCLDTAQKRLILSMALVRFVNGMVDLSQKGLYARSVQSIAEEIGLPDWIVDLRHEATHANLPSLQTLRCALGVALNWLKDEYWEAQVILHRENQENLVRWLNSYEDKQTEYMKSKKKHKKGKKEDVSKLIRDIVTVTTTNNLWFEVVAQLQGGNMFVPSSETFDKLGIKFPEVSDKGFLQSAKLPDEIFLLWKPLLEALDQASSEFIPLLTCTLLGDLLACENCKRGVSDFVPFALLSWIQYIMDSCSCNAEKDQFVFCCDMPWSTLLEMCLKQPSDNVCHLVLMILPNIASQNNLKQKIRNLLQIFLQEPRSMHESENNESHVRETTDNLLKSLVEEMRTKRNKPAINIVTSATQCSPWTLATGPTKWHTIPLGEILGLGNSGRSMDLEENLSFSRNGIEKTSGEHSIQPEADGFDEISQTCESEPDQVTPTEMTETEEEDMIVDERSIELESTCNKPHSQSETEIQQIQNAICLF